MSCYIEGEHMAEFMIRHYGLTELIKMPLSDILKVAWFFYHNPINEKEIKKIFDENEVEFKEL